MKNIIDKIIEESQDFADEDTSIFECIKLYCKKHKINEKLMEQAQRTAFVNGALEAGIPLSVIEGKTKLTDHFSQEYINKQCNKVDEDET